MATREKPRTAATKPRAAAGKEPRDPTTSARTGATRAVQTPTSTTGLDRGRVRRSRRRVILSEDERGDLANPTRRAAIRAVIAAQLEWIRARLAIEDAQNEARAAVMKFGAAVDRYALAWLAVEGASAALGWGSTPPSFTVPNEGHGEVIWDAALGAVFRLARAEKPPCTPPEEPWGRRLAAWRDSFHAPLRPEAPISIDILWVGWASARADDDLIAEVRWPRDTRASALDKVRQARAAYQRWNGRR